MSGMAEGDDEKELKQQMLQSAVAAQLTPTATAALPVSATLGSHARQLPVKAKVQKFLKSRLEILNWIGEYNSLWAVNDLIAGITLGLTIIPESIACALLAGLPPHYGLCSAFLGSFVYLFIGSIHKVIIGPTSLVALVSLQFTVGKPLEFAILLTFFAGIVEIIMGVLRLGFIFEFLSMPVIKAFSSATAILVIESQIKVLLGIKYLVSGIIGSITTLISRIDETSTGDLIMGLGAIIFLLAVGQMDRLSSQPKLGKPFRIFFRYLSFSRNTLIVIITAIISYIWIGKANSVPYALSKTALSGLPNITIPSFTIVTEDRTYNFWDILTELNVGIIAIPVIGILTNISIGKLTPRGMVDSNKETFTLGICNILGSFVQSMPVSGAFSRYSISTACGLKTPMANLYSGIIVLLALGFLSPYFNYIPEATLAAILICSVYTLLDFKLPLRLWRESKRDFCVWLLCFVVCVLKGVVVGLLVSIVVTALHLLFLWARPVINVKVEEVDDMQYVCITPGSSLYFPAINYLREKVLKACERLKFRLPVVIDCHKISGLDYTAAQGIAKLTNDLAQQSPTSSAPLILYRMDAHLQKLIDHSANLIFCDSEEKKRELLTQESLRNGNINLKEYIRASIDLSHAIDMD